MFTKSKKFPRGKRPVTERTIREIGKGREGRVSEVEYTLHSPTGKPRKVVLVEKKFHWWRVFDPFRPLTRWVHNVPAYGKPIKQVELIQELIARNKSEKLGLHLPTIVRLRDQKRGPPSIVRKKIPIVEEYTLSTKQVLAFRKDIYDQQAILARIGFYCLTDSFEPVINPATGKVEAHIIDFGTIRRKKNSKGD